MPSIVDRTAFMPPMHFVLSLQTTKRSPLFTNNALVWYQKGTSTGIGSVRNARVKHRKT
jgi:hypothetical protein